MSRKITFRQCLFDASKNPGIGFFQDKAIWVFTHVPDLSLLGGWKMAALRMFGFAYALTLLSWLLTEGITLTGIITRMLLMALFFGIVYIHMIAGLSAGMLQKWETFK